MPYLEVIGGRLWYTDSGGGGAPVVFVHPAAATSEAWQHQIEPFRAAGYRCVTYDLRGWGKSEALDAADVGTLSDDLQCLVDGLQLQRFVLIAAAYGGFGGLDYALRFQSRVQAFVLSTSQAGLADPEYRRALDRAVPEPIRGLPKYLRELGPSYRTESIEGVERWLAIDREGLADTAKRQRLHLDISLAMLESLRVPTLLIAGGADLLAPPALMRLLEVRIPQSTLKVIAEAGHSAHWERPEEWNQLALDFLARI